jgi:hypothetical protein
MLSHFPLDMTDVWKFVEKYETSLRVIFDRKLYQEVLESQDFILKQRD